VADDSHRRGLRRADVLAARYGCRHGTLSSELNKRDDVLGQAGTKLMQLWIDWAERQFRAMGSWRCCGAEPAAF
jgi:hypothetical protein